MVEGPTGLADWLRRQGSTRSPPVSVEKERKDDDDEEEDEDDDVRHLALSMTQCESVVILIW